METFDFMFGVWAGIRSIGSLFSEVVGMTNQFQLVAMLVIGSVVAVFVAGLVVVWVFG